MCFVLNKNMFSSVMRNKLKGKSINLDGITFVSPLFMVLIKGFKSYGYGLITISCSRY